VTRPARVVLEGQVRHWGCKLLRRSLPQAAVGRSEPLVRRSSLTAMRMNAEIQIRSTLSQAVDDFTPRGPYRQTQNG